MEALEIKAREIADEVISRMIRDDNYDAVHGLAMRAARAESKAPSELYLLDISGLNEENRTALQRLYAEIVGGDPHLCASELNLAGLSGSLMNAFETVTVGLLAWQTLVEEQRKLTECPQCGPNCKRGAAHNARVEDGILYKPAEPMNDNPKRPKSSGIIKRGK